MFLEKNINVESISGYRSFQMAMQNNHSQNKIKWLAAFIILVLVILFLPWTQNIQSKGEVSALDPQQRPQEVNSIIPGRIVKWYVKDGSFVKRGDTLAQITEVKDDYLDPELTDRTAEQLKAKNEAAGFYQSKVLTADKQLAALGQALQLKLAQLNNKLKQYNLQVQSDSISMLAANNQFTIADAQLKRQKELYTAGLKSLTELEQRQQYYQDALAKKISSENKYYNSKNELLNIRLELSSVEQDYTEKLSKTNGERFAALSQAATGTGEAAKLRNQLTNYRTRQGFHYILAPQSGQVLRSIKAGIGEILKDGEKLLTIVPTTFSKAVEISVDPNDLPLVHAGQLVRIQFDGFPAIVFSGWPQASYGLFSGRVVAVDNSIDAMGKFKVWVKPDETTKAWPANVRYGTGCQAIALLNNVPIWYELWRKINGFPADFYKPAAGDNAESKTKKK
ncbi:HlyD family efflux transporter periplasmic adaptor subunit [Mucilaginibacter terrenus]|uniref:HlyD family efflux transporter periplasmic adaptor subunit n=1 Tax=Mucilaginibacter terrenus TaxID=2482727 RepID=A0A3E2NWD2_9SPHI|nr:HlyD family efflux transporter periplasmic adaptor subunit [Mucilaginibacter terrenus]RFZ85302.1 HlyD family efflux transporter periplasmic adaptor subunit [Mucilaginibacter terrenus]